jgi:CheY-like chemotaxis protein
MTVLHIDDDPNDTELLRAATRRAKTQFHLFNVEDGETAIAYLSGAGNYADRSRYPIPALILLDLKMPRATGLEILKWIREHPECGRLPVVILSGSELHEDIRLAYETGANSYLVKPLGFDALVDLVKDVDAVWLPGQRTRKVPLASRAAAPR